MKAMTWLCVIFACVAGGIAHADTCKIVEDVKASGQDANLLQLSRQNEATLNAIDAYLKVLDAHEAVIAEKLATAQKVREVIEISYETLNLAGDFIRFAKTSQDLFNSLQQLDLPPIELFNDAAIQQEFQEITKKLK